VLAVGPEVPPAIGRLCATTAPSAVAVLRERFASLGRVHALDYALRETARNEQRLRREAAERDAVVESLRRSLDEVLRHRDSVMAAQALAEQRLPAQEATIVSLREGLQEAQDRAARLESAALDNERTIAKLRAETAELGRLRAEIEGLWGNLAAARADASRLQAEIDRRDSEMDALRSGAELAPTAPRARFGLRPGRH
jgi:chromosome segregation ATPase